MKRLNFKTVYLVLLFIFSIDYITTVIALNFFPKGMFVEANPIAAWFFSFGLIGWIGDYLLAVITLFITVHFVFWFRKFDKPRKDTNFYPLLMIATFFILEGYVIINNIQLLLSAVI